MSTQNEVTAIFDRELDHKAQLDELCALMNSAFQSVPQDIAPLVKLIENVVSLETSSMVVCRQFVGAVISRLDQPQIPLPVVKEIALAALNIINKNSRAISYEEQTCSLRLKLAAVLESEGKSNEAAQFLMGINVESGQRSFTAAQRMELYLRIGRLSLESGQVSEAEGFVNRASLLQTEAHNEELTIEHKAIYARVLDSKRKFIEAAQRYYELSLLDSLPMTDKKTALARAITCTILASSGNSRTRMLSTLFKDERAAELPVFGLLEKLYLDKLITVAELSDLEANLADHQRVDEYGESIVRASIVEHNMGATARLYNNISIEGLGAVLGIDAEKAEQIAAQMISSNRLNATIDQLEGFVHFSKPDPLKEWDEQIRSFCSQVNRVAEMILAEHPELAQA